MSAPQTKIARFWSDETNRMLVKLGVCVWVPSFALTASLIPGANVLHCITIANLVLTIALLCVAGWHRR